MPGNPRTTEEILRVLATVPDWALEGLLEREGLEAEGNRRQKHLRIEKGLDSERPAAEAVLRLPAEVSRIEGLLAELPEPSDAALEGFLARQGLAAADGPEERVKTARRALLAGRLTAKDLAEHRRELERIDEAVGLLQKFKRKTPPAERFRVDRGLPAEPNLPALYRSFRKALYRGALPLRQLVEHLDRLQENGRQHVLLFHIDPAEGDNRAYLDQLGDPDFWHRRFGELGIPDCLAEPRFVWKPPEPELAAVELRDDTLRLKWVETRFWLKPNPADPQQPIPRRDRAVNFFRVDLASGEAELRLAKVEHDLLHELGQGIERYRSLAARVLEFDRFTPLLLEPAVRRFLTSDQLQVRWFRIERPDGQILSGKGGKQSFFENLVLVFREFFGLAVDGDWRAARGGSPIRIRLDGRLDELRLAWEVEADEMEALLAAVRRRGRRARRSTHEDPLVEKRAVALEKIVQLLDEVGRREIGMSLVRQLARSTSIPLDDYVAAVERGAPGFEELLGATFRVSCPSTHRTVRQNGRICEFERLEEIPKQIACDNEGRARRRHKTEGRELVYFPHFKIRVHWSRLWPLVLATVLVAATTAVFAYIFSRDYSLIVNGLLACGYGLTLVAELIVLNGLVGHDRFWDAFYELKAIHAFVTDGVKGFAEGLLGRLWGPFRRLLRR